MDKKNITPEQNQPINRITSGQLPAELAELSEEIQKSSYHLWGVLLMVTTLSRALILPPIQKILKNHFSLAREADLPQ